VRYAEKDRGAPTGAKEDEHLIAAVFVDDRGGMLFHGRRQSRDREALADFARLTAGRRVWTDGFSAPLLAQGGLAPTADEAFLARCGAGEYCFVEDRPLLPWAERLEGLVLYRWNRAYPGDFFLDADPAALGLVLAERTEFSGSSHPRITRERYERRERA
jgi:hypothetical protein